MLKEVEREELLLFVLNEVTRCPILILGSAAPLVIISIAVIFGVSNTMYERK